MAKMNLSEEETAVIKDQFGQFLSGRVADDNMLVSAYVTTMHTDSHYDTHNDGC
jgi:hypothetical protein